MNMIIQITTAIALILSIIVPFGCFFLGEKNKKRYKKSLIANCFMFFGVLLVATVVSFAGTASVQAAALQLMVLLQVSDILVQLLLQVFPVLVPVSPLQAPQVQLSVL